MRHDGGAHLQECGGAGVGCKGGESRNRGRGLGTWKRRKEDKDERERNRREGRETWAVRAEGGPSPSLAGRVFRISGMLGMGLLP